MFGRRAMSLSTSSLEDFNMNRGYSIFVMNITFISSSEVKCICTSQPRNHDTYIHLFLTILLPHVYLSVYISVGYLFLPFFYYEMNAMFKTKV